MGLKELIFNIGRRKPDPKEIANQELLKAAKNVCRVAAYQTLAIKALKLAIEKVERTK